MCQAVRYLYEGRELVVPFSRPRAALPVLRKGGGIELLSWGRRIREPGQLPKGGWARHGAILSGQWDRWDPRPVKIPVEAFLERDVQGDAHWFPVTAGQWLQGLVAHAADEVRIYVVTLEPQRVEAEYPSWPRVVNG